MKKLFLVPVLALCITSCGVTEGSKASPRSIFEKKQAWNDAQQTAQDMLVLRCGNKKDVTKDEIDALTRRIIKCRKLLELAKGEPSSSYYNNNGGARDVYLKQYDGECRINMMG